MGQLASSMPNFRRGSTRNIVTKQHQTVFSDLSNLPMSIGRRCMAGAGKSGVEEVHAKSSATAESGRTEKLLGVSGEGNRARSKYMLWACPGPWRPDICQERAWARSHFCCRDTGSL